MLLFAYSIQSIMFLITRAFTVFSHLLRVYSGLFLFFKGSHKTAEHRHWSKVLFFRWQLQTRYHIFGLCLRGAAAAGRRGED